MSSFRKSLVALVGLLALVVALAAPLSPASAAPEDKEKGPRKFYLTKTTHKGDEALTACAAGYHMASLWEILDPSNLRYDTELGVTAGDSGSGPPSSGSFWGWIRTGRGASISSSIGVANCQAWTSASIDARGTVVFLDSLWDSTGVTSISPWRALPTPCAVAQPVWCVED